MRPVSSLLFGSTLIALSACQAVAPVAPAPVPAAMVILHSGFTHLSAYPFFDLSAYLVDSDGLYTNVTDKAQWTVSNPAILRDNSGPSGVGATSHDFFVTAPGPVNVLASYQGLAAVMPVDAVQFSAFVRPVNLPTFGAPVQLMHTLKLTARDLQFNDVTSAASWVSSNPSVATVDRGVVTAVSIGTTTITVALGGGTDSVTLSVYPSRFNR